MQANGEKKTISLVIPILNEENVLDELFQRVSAVVDAHPAYDWQVVCVNDGSTDGSGQKLTTLSGKAPWLTVLHLSRNFGHQIAISAGVDHTRGDAVIVMDGDLQDPPELISEMLTHWEAGHDVVYATRKRREGEGFFKRATAAAYYRLLGRLSDVPIPLDTGDFRLMSRPVVNALRRMPEKNRFVRGMVSWVGFSQMPVYYERDKRYAGNTKYSLLHMAIFALDGLMSFSKVPLRWITTLGFFMSLSSLLSMVGVVILKLADYKELETGWSSLMGGILMLGGIQLICLGMIGEYVGRIFDEVRGRPLYLIRRIDAGGRALPEACPACGHTT